MNRGPRIAVLVEEGQRGQVSPRWVRQMAQRLLVAEGDGASIALSIAIAGDETLAQLNRSFRGAEGPTDVLSFRFDGAASEGETPFLVPLRWASLQGEIVVSLPAVQRTASTEGRPWRQELAHVLAHGLLHLQGYDHAEPDERRALEEREEKRLAAALGPHRPFHRSSA